MLMLDANTYPRLAGIFDLLNCIFQEKSVHCGSIGEGLAEKPHNPLLVRNRKLFPDVEGSWCSDHCRREEQLPPETVFLRLIVSCL